MQQIPERVQRLVKSTRRLIQKIDRVVESLSSVSEYGNFQLVEERQFAGFSLSVFKLGTEAHEGQRILRVEPEIEVEAELFNLLYRSELVPERLKDAVSTGTSYGLKTFQMKVDAPESLRDYAIDQIIIKFRKAFWAFSKPETRQELLKLKRKLEIAEEKGKSQREKEILKEKINDLLFYTVQLPE